MQKQSSRRKAAPSGICDSQKATTSVTTSRVCPVCTEAQKVKRSNKTRRTRTLLDSCSSAKMSFQICQPRSTSTLPQPKLHFTVLDQISCCGHGDMGQHQVARSITRLSAVKRIEHQLSSTSPTRYQVPIPGPLVAFHA